MRRGTALRFTDVEGGANLSALFWNFEDKERALQHARHAQGPAHRVPDARTLRVSPTWAACLFSIVEDTAGWHDTVCGVIDDATMTERFGAMRFQEHRNAMHRSGREGLLKEMGRWGLGKRDLHANVNFFSKVTTDADGNLSLVAAETPPGASCGCALRHGRAAGDVRGAASFRSQKRASCTAAGEADRLAGRHCACRRLLPQLPRREPARIRQHRALLCRLRSCRCWSKASSTRRPRW